MQIQTDEMIALKMNKLKSLLDVYEYKHKINFSRTVRINTDKHISYLCKQMHCIFVLSHAVL